MSVAGWLDNSASEPRSGQAARPRERLLVLQLAAVLCARHSAVMCRNVWWL